MAKVLKTGAGMALVVQVGAQEWNGFVDKAMEEFHFDKALRIIARLRKFFLLIMEKKKIRLDLTANEKNAFSVLSDYDMQGAMEECARRAQQSCFQQEIAALRGDNYKASCSRLGTNITVFLDKREGMRVLGRLQQSELPFEQKHPLVLPSKNAVTKDIILFLHRTRGHISSEMVLYRSRFFLWILRGQKTASRVIRKRCVPCKRWTGRPVRAPMGDLLWGHLEPARPFAHAGPDVGGPLTIRVNKVGARKFDKRGRPSLQTMTAVRKKEKDVATEAVHFLVFTCLTTRFLQVELLRDLTADSICEALLRVAATFGKSKSFYSDNALYFNRTRTLLVDQVDRRQLQEARRRLEGEGMTWDFSTARAPFQNECSEGAVRALKGSLKKVLGGALLMFDELRTAIAQSVGFINSRPLASLTEESSFSPVTPNLLVLGFEPDHPQGMVKIEREEARHLRLRLKHRQATMTQMWNKWHKDYLAQLIQTKK